MASAHGFATSGGGDSRSPVPDAFPSHPPELVREMVIAAHGNFDRVKELVTRHPTLTRACYDWGFGDFEDALGGASHIGHRPIADYLIANGARPTIFSAAMLGQLDVVKAFVAASPGVQRVKGPHSITLLAHAKAGKDAARAVVEYLESLGDADQRQPTQPLTDADKTMIIGTYVYGDGATERITIEPSKSMNGMLTFMRAGTLQRPIHHLGGREFFPAGADNVRIRFTVEGDRAVAVSVHDPDLIVTARRTS